jgi:hypothetical protein
MEEIDFEELKKIYIYESPDKGKTIYQREFLMPHDTRELIITE